jgi:hypothetical protein
MNGSKTTSPGSEYASKKNSTSARGNGAECDPCEDSDFTSTTLLGRASPVCRPSESSDRLFLLRCHALWFFPGIRGRAPRAGPQEAAPGV